MGTINDVFDSAENGVSRKLKSSTFTKENVKHALNSHTDFMNLQARLNKYLLFFVAIIYFIIVILAIRSFVQWISI